MRRIMWWPLFGVSRRLTERGHFDTRLPAARRSETRVPVRPLSRRFRRSLFVYPVDVGNSNALNIELAALRTPQYNVHRFGIFFTDTPRHADLLLVLGRPTHASSMPLAHTIAQLPEPFGIVHVYEPFPDARLFSEVELPNLLARVEGVPSADELLGILLAAARGGTR